ncbi:MAG: nuclear transport factor 2 family protein [Saprospiraceae bacterium]|nr:nuclear transport factor 2 family protein [Saprospiraceae bacterium]
MKHFTLYLLFTLSSQVILSGSEVVIPSVDTSELTRLIDSYYKTMSARNWKAYKAYFTNDAVLTTVWQASPESEPILYTNTIDGFLSQTKDGPDSQPIFEETPISTEVEIRGNLARAWVKYEAKFGTEDSLMKWKGYDLFSFIRHKDQWLIAALTYISIE